MLRFAGIIVAIGIIFSLEYWLRTEWYVAVPVGVLGYIIIRYTGHFVRARRHIRETMDAAKRHQISN